MKKSIYLGEFEVAILLALVRLGSNAYGMTIRRDLANRTGRDISIGSVYTTLYRLENKGFITSSTGDATGARGDRAKRFFLIEAKGLEALYTTKSQVDATWEGFELVPQLATKTKREEGVVGSFGLSSA